MSKKRLRLVSDKIAITDLENRVFELEAELKEARIVHFEHINLIAGYRKYYAEMVENES